MSARTGYESTAFLLADRMEEFMHSQPLAVDLKSPWDLVTLGFELGSLNPSAVQAELAFIVARRRVRGASEGPQP